MSIGCKYEENPSSLGAVAVGWGEAGLAEGWEVGSEAAGSEAVGSAEGSAEGDSEDRRRRR